MVTYGLLFHGTDDITANPRPLLYEGAPFQRFRVGGLIGSSSGSSSGSRDQTPLGVFGSGGAGLQQADGDITLEGAVRVLGASPVYRGPRW